jgi:hypothetical protein
VVKVGNMSAGDGRSDLPLRGSRASWGLPTLPSTCHRTAGPWLPDALTRQQVRRGCWIQICILHLPEESGPADTDCPSCPAPGGAASPIRPCRNTGPANPGPGGHRQPQQLHGQSGAVVRWEFRSALSLEHRWGPRVAEGEQKASGRHPGAVMQSLWSSRNASHCTSTRAAMLLAATHCQRHGKCPEH